MKRLLAAIILFSLTLTACACQKGVDEKDEGGVSTTVRSTSGSAEDVTQTPLEPTVTTTSTTKPSTATTSAAIGTSTQAVAKPPSVTTAPPVMMPIKNPREDVLICLDAGHGLIDPGAIGYLNGNTYYEKTFNLAIARRTKEKLEALGYRVMMIRDGDTSLLGGSDPSASYKTADEAMARRKKGKNAGASLYLSIHCNAYVGSKRAYGPLVFYNSSSATTYRAWSLARTFCAKFTAANANYPTAGACDIREGNGYIVLKDLSMPALLLEIGFMTDAGDLALLNRADWQNDCAGAIANGVEEAFLAGLIE